MEIIIALIISAAAALFIALPLFTRSGNKGPDAEEKDTKNPVLTRALALEGQKDSLYSAIRDIDLDYGLGKLTKEDYDELRQKYRAEAANVLKELDQLANAPAAGSIDAEIEAEIEKTRAITTESTLGDELEKEILGARKAVQSEFSAPSLNSCASCGNQLQIQDLFCSKCGAKVGGLGY